MYECRYASGFPVSLVLVPFKQGHCYIQPMHFFTQNLYKFGIVFRKIIVLSSAFCYNKLIAI